MAAGTSGACGPGLDPHERGEEDGGSREQRQRGAGDQPVVGGVVQGVDEQQQPAGHGGRAAEVEPACRGRRADRPRGTRGRATMATLPTGTLMKNAQRQPGPAVSRPLATTPTEPAAPPTAPKMPNARSRSRPSAKVTASSERAAGAIECGAESLHGPGRDQQAGALRGAGHERRGREDGKSGDEDAPASQVVGHPPAEQEEPTEHQAVGDDDPLRRAGSDAEIVLDRRHGHVHDGGVDPHHRHGARTPGRARGPASLAVRLPCVAGGALRLLMRAMCRSSVWSVCPTDEGGGSRSTSPARNLFRTGRKRVAQVRAGAGGPVR